MTREELLAKLQAHEDNFVERKLEGVREQDIRKAVVAFANSVPEGREAVLFIGVGDNGTIAGCANTDDKQKKVRKVCEQDCYPPIRFASEVLSTDSGDVIAVVITASANRPHFAGHAYVRRGSESVTASSEILDQLIESRISKLAAIQKLRDQVISVISLRHKLGDAKVVTDNRYREGAECRVIECNATSVRLQDISSGKYISEPLDHVKVTRDEEKHRAMFVVTGY